MAPDDATPPPAEATGAALIPAQASTRDRALVPARAAPAMPALSASTLEPAQKAAIVLVALGAERAADVLRDMGEGNIRRFARAVSKLDHIPREAVEQVVGEFLESMGDELTVKGGLGEARKFLGQVLDGETLGRVMEDIDGRAGRSLWMKLSDAQEAPLASWLSTEHPQVASVVLGKMRSDRAARLLERFDSTFAQDVVLRMSRTPAIDPEAMDRVKAVIEHDFVSVMERAQGARRPAEMIAGLMNHASGDTREAMLRHLENSEPRLAQEVQRVMFTFSDISSRLNPRDVGRLVKETDEPVLMAALKGGMAVNDPSVEFILGNISRRLSERMREDLAAMQEVRRKEGEAAQAEVVAVIQQLVKAGDIKLIEIEAIDG